MLTAHARPLCLIRSSGVGFTTICKRPQLSLGLRLCGEKSPVRNASISLPHQRQHYLTAGLFLGYASLFYERRFRSASGADVPDTVFAISQRGNCSASSLLSSQESRNRQESHKVNYAIHSQLLLNSGSCKVEHQHTSIPYSHSNNLREL